MTIARAHLVDPSVTRWYHCITRCVRRAFLLGEGPDDRKVWIENRLRELAEIFSVAVGGFSVMDNHLHVLVRLDPELAAGWSDEEVVRRWGRLFPPRDKSRQPLPVSNDWVEWRLKDAAWVAKARAAAAKPQLVHEVPEGTAVAAGQPGGQTRGAFFEGRFKSVAILDEESLLATCAYIDLNPVAAGIAEVPEASAHTSIKERVDHVKAQGRTEDLKAARERQRGRIGRIGGAGGVALALSDRGPAPARFGAGRDARRVLAGQLPAAGRLHRPVVPRGQGGDLA